MGDQDFIDIIEENKQKIFRICKLYAMDPLEPEDLFQEIIYQVWKSLPGFQGQSAVGTWIYKIALNVSYRSNLKNKKLNKNMVKLDTVEVQKINTVDEPNDQAQYNALQECIRQLNKADQSILVLYLEELQYQEIAVIIGISENYVAVKMKRIREILFKCITPKLN